MRPRRPALFRKRQFEPSIIATCVRWYCRFSLSLRDLEELMAERGLAVDHTTIWRWVQRYGPEVHRRLRGNLNQNLRLGTSMKPSFGLPGADYTCSVQSTARGRPWILSFPDARSGRHQTFLEEGIGESRQPCAQRIGSGWSAQLSSSDPRTARRGPDASVLSASHPALCEQPHRI